MKYLLIFILCINLVNAGEVSFSVSQASRLASGDSIEVGNWHILQVNYTPKDEFYYFLSYETMAVMPKSYKAFDYELIGLGVGDEYKLNDRVSIFGQFGFYLVSNSWGDRKQFNESLYYFINDEFVHSGHSGNPDLPYHQFNRFIVENEKGVVAGTIGIKLNKPITDALTVNLGMSYRLLKIRELFVGTADYWDYDNTGTAWQVGGVGDYSSINVSLGLNYKF